MNELQSKYLELHHQYKAVYAAVAAGEDKKKELYGLHKQLIEIESSIAMYYRPYSRYVGTYHKSVEVMSEICIPCERAKFVNSEKYQLRVAKALQWGKANNLQVVVLYEPPTEDIEPDEMPLPLFAADKDPILTGKKIINRLWCA
jgi:hypothetical protein